MNEQNFEGTEVLEKLAGVNKLDEFLEAVDADDFRKAKQLMRLASVDSESIEIVLKKMSLAEGD